MTHGNEVDTAIAALTTGISIFRVFHHKIARRIDDTAEILHEGGYISALEKLEAGQDRFESWMASTFLDEKWREWHTRIGLFNEVDSALLKVGNMIRVTSPGSSEVEWYLRIVFNTMEKLIRATECSKKEVEDKQRE